MTGIYKITNRQNGKVYIGQASNIERRISEHKKQRYIPIDMWINMIGVENFDFEILEECPQEQLDIKEKEYIQKYNSINDGYNIQEGGYNNSVGEGNGRAKLTYEDVIKIRTAYNNHLPQKQVYSEFQDKVTFNQFQAVWQGRSWSNVMPEVFTQENKNYYIYQKDKENASISPEELLEYRKYYQTHTYKEVYDKLIAEKGEVIKERSFQKILTGDVRPDSIYMSVPVFKKKTKTWELNGEPVSTISESGE